MGKPTKKLTDAQYDQLSELVTKAIRTASSTIMEEARRLDKAGYDFDLNVGLCAEIKDPYRDTVNVVYAGNDRTGLNAIDTGLDILADHLKKHDFDIGTVTIEQMVELFPERDPKRLPRLFKKLADAGEAMEKAVKNSLANETGINEIIEKVSSVLTDIRNSSNSNKH